MKYLKSFETVEEKDNFALHDDVISFVSETDHVYANKMYKVCSYTLHLTNDTDAVALYGSGYKSVQIEGTSTINKVTIAGKPVDMDSLFPYQPYSSDYYHAMTRVGSYVTTPDGNIIYHVLTRIEQTEAETYTEGWFDLRTGIVRDALTNEPLEFIFEVQDDEQIVPGTYPLYCDICDNEDLPFYNEPADYIMVNGNKQYISSDAKYENLPAGDYEVIIYSQDENMTFRHGSAFPSDTYLNFTLSKNVKKLKAVSFGGNIYTGFDDIWYEGTVSQFNEIEKEDKWNCSFYGTKYVETVHCTDGDVSV